MPTPQPPRGLLIGTRATVRQMRQMLGDEARVLPCVIAGEPLHEPGAHAWDQLHDVLMRGGFERVYVSLPLAMTGPLSVVSTALRQRGVSWRWLPCWADQLAGRLRPPSGFGGTTLEMSDLIGRPTAPLDDDAIRACVTGKAVMITGAGGSIGSELARLVAAYAPAKLLLVERAENALFEIDREIAQRFPDLTRQALLHDVTDAASTVTLASAHRPQTFFHAAAHKHVPMMEEHPAAAVENNFYGTRSIADAAVRVGAERFVMISTDKAVRPSSVMGASKRLAELYVQYLATTCPTRMSIVRFGNVLGSACSVLPIWTRQLAEGAPLTVTHPAMTRYFMTIPEAAGLVLQSAAYASEDRRADLFVLDMGEPVHILDLARRFIAAHGLEPIVDVPITFTGVRPGEKLTEELTYQREQLEPTPHRSIRRLRDEPPSGNQMQQLIASFDRLRAKPQRNGHLWQLAHPDAIIAALHAAIPQMQPAATTPPAAARVA